MRNIDIDAKNVKTPNAKVHFIIGGDLAKVVIRILLQTFREERECV